MIQRALRRSADGSIAICERRRSGLIRSVYVGPPSAGRLSVESGDACDVAATCSLESLLFRVSEAVSDLPMIRTLERPRSVARLMAATVDACSMETSRVNLFNEMANSTIEWEIEP